MAIESNLDIRIRALIEGVDKLAQFASQLRDTATAADEVGKAGGKAGDAGSAFSDFLEKVGSGKGQTESFGDGLKALGSQVEFLTDALKKAAVAFIGFLAIKGAKEIADTAARAETLGVTLGIVARNAGYSTQQISDYEAKVRALGITTESTRDSLTKMIQAGLALGPAAGEAVSQAEKLARAAQDLAVVTGENSSATLQRLITNISQLDTVGLRFQGLIVDREAAEAKFAATLGKTADQLTQQQKVQAFSNAALAEAAKLQGAYEASLDTVGKKVQSLTRYQTEAANSLGQLLLPAYGALVDSATRTLKAIDEVAQSLGKNTSVAQTLGQAVDALVQPFERLIIVVAKIAADLTPTAAAVVQVVADLTGQVVELVAAFAGSLSDLGVFRTIMVAVGLTVAAVADGLTVLIVGLQTGVLAFLRFSEFVAVAEGRLLSFIGATTAAANANDIAKTLGAQADGVEASIKKTIKNYEDGNSALGKFTAALQNNVQVQAKAVSEQQKNFSAFDAQITDLVGKISQSKLNGTEAAAAIDEFGKKIKSAGEAGDLTDKQISQLNARLGSLALTAKDAAGKAFSDLGVKITDVGGVKFAEPINKQFGEVSTALSALAQNVTVTDTQFRQTFTRGLDTAKSVADITVLKNVLNDAALAGKDTSIALDETARAFQRTFQSDLKAAQSIAEINDLRAKVEDIAKKFPELGTVARQALDQIAERSNNAGKTLLETSQQLLAATQAQGQIAKAGTEVAKANLDVAKARLTVEQAQLAFQREGTPLAAAKLEQAKAELALAEALKVSATIRLNEEKAALDVLIAKQRVYNAEKANAPQDVLNSLNAEVQQRELALSKIQQQQVAQGLVVERLREAVVVTQEQVVQQERMVVAAQQTAGALSDVNAAGRRAAEFAEDAKNRTEQWRGTFTSMVPTVDSVSAALREAGVASEEIDERAKEITAEWQRLRGGAGTTWNQVWDAIDRANRKTEDVIASTQDAAENALLVGENFERARQAIEDANLGLGDAAGASLSLGAGADKAAEAMREVQRQAAQTARSALDAARSFANSVESIQIELLSAQGRDEEASKLRFEARKRELGVQYELLKVQLQIAEVQAKAAGIDTGAIESAIKSAEEGYKQALSNLDELEKIDQERIRKQKAEEARQKAADDARLVAEQAINNARSSAQTQLTRNLTEVAGSAAGVDVAAGAQSIAQPGVATAAGGIGAQPLATYQLDLSLGGKAITAQVPADQGKNLLDLLEQTRRRS